MKLGLEKNKTFIFSSEFWNELPNACSATSLHGDSRREFILFTAFHPRQFSAIIQLFYYAQYFTNSKSWAKEKLKSEKLSCFEAGMKIKKKSQCFYSQRGGWAR